MPSCSSIPAVCLTYGMEPQSLIFQEEPTEIIFNSLEGWVSLMACQFEGRLNNEKKEHDLFNQMI